MKQRPMAVLVALALVFNQGMAMAAMLPSPDTSPAEMASHCATSADAAQPGDSTPPGGCCADGHCNCAAHAALVRVPVIPSPLLRHSADVSRADIRLQARCPDDPLRPPID